MCQVPTHPPSVSEEVHPAGSVHLGAQLRTMKSACGATLREVVRLQMILRTERATKITRIMEVAIQAPDHSRSPWQKQGQVSPAMNRPPQQRAPPIILLS